MRTLIVPPGIGDCCWLIMKLLSTSERFHIHIPGSLPQRGKQLWDMLPQLVVSCRYTKDTTHEVLKKTVTRFTRDWGKIRAGRFHLSFNKHLEDGKRIERALKDLPTSFIIPYQTGLPDVSVFFDGSPTIGIYCSAYSNARHWDMWQVKQWVEFINIIHAERPAVRFIFIGAEYDIDLSRQIMEAIPTVPHISTIGEPLPVVIEILKRLDYFVGFPSGLSILHETLGKPGLMFYPEHLKRMMGTWAHPSRIMKEHIPMLKASPAEVVGVINKYYNLFERV